MSYTFIDEESLLDELLPKIQRHKQVIGADIESTGLDWIIDDILLFQISLGDDIYIVDIRKLGYNNLTKLIGWLVSSDNRIIFHNAKFDLKFLYHRTRIMMPLVYDTMTAEAVLNSGIGKTFYSLQELAEKYSGVFMEKDARNEFINMPKDMPFSEKQLTYSALDVKVLREIHDEQMSQFLDTKQDKVIELESNLVPVVAMMEYDGIRLDTKMWLELEKEAIIQRDVRARAFRDKIIEFLIYAEFPNGLELVRAARILQKNKFTKKMTAFLEDITDLPNLKGWLDEHFNLKSTQQVTAIFNLMGIDCPDTNEKTLEDYKEYPIVGELIELRGINKQIDQYGSSFLDSIHPVTGKIHTEYLTVGTQTGRFSSSKPNLQNVPVHGGYRECFLPDEGYLFAAVDYSQQEYRLAGAVSRESVIIQAYKDGSDMHTATGKIVAKKDVITKDERSRGKTVNFAILYGSTEWGLKNNLRIKVDEAKQIIKDFWEGYPALKKFMDKVGDIILERGYSNTPLGRRRYNVPKPTFGNANVYLNWKARVLREGRNHIIQGGGADIIKIAMVEIWRENPFGDLLKLTLQIHDEIVAQVHKSIAEEGLAFIKAKMTEVEQRFLKDTPAAVDGDLKERWSK